MARNARFPVITPEEAHGALRWLVATGKVKAREIKEALAKRERLIREVKVKLEALGGEGLRFLRNAESLRPRATARQTPKRVSAARRAAWRAQGRYMAAVRRLPKSSRSQIKTIREKKGVAAAIVAAKKLSK